MSTYLNPYSLQGFSDAPEWTVLAKQGTDIVFQGVNYSGAQGTQGPRGLQGLQGTRGLQGLQGTRGLQGLQGTRGLQGLQGNAGPTVQSDYTQADSAALDYIKNAPIVRIYRNVTYTAPQTSNPKWSARFDVTDSSITSYTDGMVVCIKLSGNTASSSYRNAFQINSLGYKGLVYGTNSDVDGRYPSGGIVWAVYNATQNANLYLGGAQSVTGCWQIMDYTKTTSTNDYLAYSIRTQSSVRKTTGLTGGYRILFSTPDNVGWVPPDTNGDFSTSSIKTVNQSPINPFGRIVFNANTATQNANTEISETTAWDQYVVNLFYSFRTGGSPTSLVKYAPVYIECIPQDDGSAVIDDDEPYVMGLPSSYDGRIYIYLGTVYNANGMIGLEYNHPVYYHDGIGVRLWTGSVSGVNLVDLT